MGGFQRVRCRNQQLLRTCIPHSTGRAEVLLLHQSRFSHVPISPTECSDVGTLNYAKINPFPPANDIQTRIIHKYVTPPKTVWKRSVWSDLYVTRHPAPLYCMKYEIWIWYFVFRYTYHGMQTIRRIRVCCLRVIRSSVQRFFDCNNYYIILCSAKYLGIINSHDSNFRTHKCEWILKFAWRSY